MLLQMIFWTTLALSNARCHCTEYYKYPRILPKHHTWLKIQNSITIIRDYLFGFSKFVSTFNIFFLLLCLHSIFHCKFYTLINQLLLLWHKYLESLGKSDIFTPEQFTFVLQLAVRPIIQLKIPPHLSAPTELKFEKERLTPEEITEENCCNLILP